MKKHSPENELPEPSSAEDGPSCDCGDGGAGDTPTATDTMHGDRIHPYRGDGAWEGVLTEAYKDRKETNDAGSFAGVLRRTIVGGRGERTAFHLRYFEVAPGGRTSRERHEHEHVVIGVRGRGMVTVAGTIQPVGPMDVVYVAPGSVHQILNTAEEPFGFFCIVDAERDRPVPAPPDGPDILVISGWGLNPFGAGAGL